MCVCVCGGGCTCCFLGQGPISPPVSLVSVQNLGPASPDPPSLLCTRLPRLLHLESSFSPPTHSCLSSLLDPPNGLRGPWLPVPPSLRAGPDADRALLGPARQPPCWLPALVAPSPFSRLSLPMVPATQVPPTVCPLRSPLDGERQGPGVSVSLIPETPVQKSVCGTAVCVWRISCDPLQAAGSGGSREHRPYAHPGDGG